MIGLIQVGDQAMADRYAYFSLIGIFVIAVWGIADIAESLHFNLKYCAAVASVILLVLSILTWRQIGIWFS